jgi:hypothetical protein
MAGAGVGPPAAACRRGDALIVQWAGHCARVDMQADGGYAGPAVECPVALGSSPAVLTPDGRRILYESGGQWSSRDTATWQPSSPGAGLSAGFNRISSRNEGAASRIVWRSFADGRLLREAVVPFPQRTIIGDGGSPSLVLIKRNSTIEAWDVWQGRSRWQLKVSGGDFSMATSPDDRQVVWLDGGSHIHWIDALTGQVRISQRSSLLGVYDCTFTSDSTRLAVTSSGSEAARLYDTVSRQELITLPGHGSLFNDLQASPDFFTARNLLNHIVLWRAPAWDQIERAELLSAAARERLAADGARDGATRHFAQPLEAIAAANLLAARGDKAGALRLLEAAWDWAVKEGLLSDEAIAGIAWRSLDMGGDTRRAWLAAARLQGWHRSKLRILGYLKGDVLEEACRAMLALPRPPATDTMRFGQALYACSRARQAGLQAEALAMERSLLPDDTAPGVAWPRQHRMAHWADCGEWSGALQDAALLAAPGDRDALFHLMVVQGLARDPAALRETAAAACTLYQDDSSYFTKDRIAKGAMLLPDTAPPEAATMAAAAAKKDPDNTWARLLTAIAALRAGQWERVIAQADAALVNGDQTMHSALHALRAMAFHQLGRTEEAGDALAAAHRTIAPPPLETFQLQESSWRDRAVSRIFLREAEESLKNFPLR